MYSELIHKEQYEGFDICLYADEEDLHPSNMFEEEEDKELLEKIYSGEYSYFCARVTAYKNGIRLADEYLGCCCYANREDFMTEGGYYEDMRDAVVNQAQSTIRLLCEVTP